MNNKHPIIAHGELYAEPVKKRILGGPKTLPRDYPEAKQRMIEDLDKLTNKIEESEEVFLDEKVICLRLEPKFEAKSYVPDSIIRAISDEGADIVGGRKYTVHQDEDENGTSAKLYFMRTSDNGIHRLRNILDSGERDHISQWKQQIQSVHSIDLLDPDEKVMGFADSWETGAVEFVLHPLDSTEDEIERFFLQSGIDTKKAKIKTYDGGITFISAACTSENVQRAKMFNPLRAAHPIGSVRFVPIRHIPTSNCPTVIVAKNHPSIKVGVFDGGADEDIPLLKGYVTAIDGTTEPANSEYLAHGSGVCSAILYGNLADCSGTIGAPDVMIDCYRVFPLRDNSDLDLYEIIDLIEDVVPNSHGTKLFNLSFGPVGAIVDDSISRFTYALDKLSYEVPEGEESPLFVVAVGNDGDLEPELNRIQSPSDIVNGLGIGAYTFDARGNKTIADYSCVGPGREGAKIKPDLLDFGGSAGHPFVFPALDHTSLSASAGTSFAAPMVTGKIGKLMSMSKDVSPQVGRTLLIHAASIDPAIPQVRQGFGFCADDVSRILECDDNRITIIYNGTIMPTQYLSLPIFAPHINEMKGNVHIAWTVATVVAPYSNDPDAYTNNCLEDTFVPHSMIYSFSKRGKKSEKINLLNPSDIPHMRHLLDDGYKQSSTPISHPAKKVWEEEDLRAVDYKWDTVIHKCVSMRSSSLFDPSITLHAIGRNGYETKEIKYHVAITIDAPKYAGSLYDAVLQTYQNLAPIEIRNINRLLIQ